MDQTGMQWNELQESGKEWLSTDSLVVKFVESYGRKHLDRMGWNELDRTELFIALKPQIGLGSILFF